MPKLRPEDVRRAVLRRWAMVLAAILLAVTWCAVALAQGPGPKKKEEGAVLLLLLPLAIFVCASLQMAVMGVFPRFARRCATAVDRYRWQTPLVGLAAFLAVALLAAMANAAAGGNQQAGFPFVMLGTLVATMGGVGVSLLAGRWALKRIGSEAPAHPIVEVLAGSSLLGWVMILVPCAGQVLWVVASWAAMGAFFFALLGGRRLDEAPLRRAVVPPAAPPSPAVPTPPEPEPEPESTDDSQMF
ncbi:MAG: hypothetical protein FJX75_09600 [Armatimonadetes bacterium]|nr:hypothetical protein [Armatimonadota bacterium]